MGCLQRNMDELWLFCHWNRTREVVFSLWSVENCHLFKRESLITLNKTASGVGTTFLHLDWLHIRKEMRSLSKCSLHRQAGHLKGLFVIRPPPHLPPPRQSCIFTTGLLTVWRWLVWQLDRPFLVCPSDTVQLGLELLSKTSMSGRTGDFMEEKQDLACPFLTGYSRAAIISHPLTF